MEGQEGKVNGQEQAIVPAATAAVMSVEEETKLKLARAEQSIAFRKGILRLIAANLEPSDITIYGEGDKETVHLTKHACKQILSWAGIAVHPGTGILEKKYDGVEGPYIDFEVWATWTRPDGSMHGPSFGNRATNDDWFAKRTKYTCEACGADLNWKDVSGKDRPFCKANCKGDGQPTRYEKTSYYLPVTEVDIPSIKQAAITNLWNHIVLDAGLTPSKNELLSVGFRFTEVKDRVKFGTDKKDSSAPSQPKGAAATPSTPQTAAAPAPQAEPPKEQPKEEPKKKRTRKPQDVARFAGYMSQVWLNNWSKGGQSGRFVKAIVNGQTVLCFHDGVVVTKDGDKNLLELLVEQKGRYCRFLISQRQTDKGTTFYIEGAEQIGPYAWDNGVPCLAPAQDPAPNNPGITNEDIPF